MKHLLLSALFIIPAYSFAQVDDARNIKLVDAEFERLHHTASINCEYKWWINVSPVETIKQTYIPNKSVSAQYKIGDGNLNVEITSGDEKGIVSYELAGTTFLGTLSKFNYIHLDLANLSEKQQKVSEKYNLPNLTCSLEIAYEDNYVIENEKLHVAMHPYNLYDLDGESTAGIVKHLEDKSMDQLLLLDDVSNIRKGQMLNINEFLINGAPNLEIKTLTPVLSGIKYQMPFDIPEDIPMRVAPAGHLRFTLTHNNHEITYTGGNHNYCIMTSTRRALNAFFEKPGSESITFNYATEGVVVQYKSYLKELKIPKKVFFKSNLLKNVILNMTDEQRAIYFDGHFNWYAGYYLNTKQYMFGTATLIRKGIGPDKVQKVEGKGTGNVTIIFNYI